MANDRVTQLLEDPRFHGSPITWEITTDEYEKIRWSWLIHVSIEEELFQPHTEEQFRTRFAEMLSVFVDDCTMELVQTGERWTGREETEAFYRQFLGAFEGMVWTPQALVIGPQGVQIVSTMTGTQHRPFAGLPGTGQPVHLQWVISFPWVREAGKFQGETIYSIRPVAAS